MAQGTMFVLGLVFTLYSPVSERGAVAAAFYAAPSTPRAPVDLTGHWEAGINGDSRAFTFLFDFVTNGDTLTGTVAIAGQDRKFRISEGRISDNRFTFNGFGLWSGSLDGDELHLTRELDYGVRQEMTARRVRRP